MFKNKFGVLLFSAVAYVVSGCSAATKVVEDDSVAKRVKNFNAPKSGYAGIYVYRDASVFDMFKSLAVGLNVSYSKKIYFNDVCAGELDNGYFYYFEVPGEKTYKVSTTSEFGLNDLNVKTKSGKLYYVEQSLKTGIVISGSEVNLIKKDKAQKAIKELALAKQTGCK